MDAVHTRVNPVSSSFDTDPPLDEALAAVLDLAGVGFIILRRCNPAVLYTSAAARTLMGLEHETILEIGHLLERISRVATGGLDSKAQYADHPVNRALAGEAAANVLCLIIDNRSNLERHVRLSYGPDSSQAATYLLIEEAPLASNHIASNHVDSTQLDPTARDSSSVPGAQRPGELEQRLRSQLDRLYIPTFVWRFVGEDFVLIDFNEAALAVTEGEVARNRGLRASLIYAGRPDLLDHMRACFETRSTVSREVEHPNWRDGQTRDWIKTFTYVPPDVVMVQAEDITARKLAEKLLRDREERLRILAEQVPAELRQSEERYRAFVEQSSEGIWRLEVTPPIPTTLTVDEQADLLAERAYVAECNDAMAQMYGLSKASDMVGRGWKSIHVEGDSLNLDGLRGFVKEGYRVSESESHDMTDVGEVKYFSNNAVGIVESGALVRIWGTQRDITQARLAEQALRASESRFSLAFNSAPVVIGITRAADGKCIDVNETFLRLTGFTREEVVGRTGQELGLWVDPEAVRRIRGALNEAKSVRDAEVTQRMKSGELRYFVLSADIIELGDEECVITVGADITDRKLAEGERASLLASEKAARLEAEQANQYRAELLAREQSARAQAEAAWLEWQQTFDAMAEEVSLVDVEGRLLRANKAFYAWWGKTPEQCVGRPLHEIAHRSEGEAASCAICDLRSRGERAAIEFPPGSVSERPLYVAIDPILNPGGETIGFVQQIKDLSDLYHARALAERERTSLNAIIEQMAEGLIVCDEKGVVTRANALAQQFFGFSLDEMAGDKTHELPRHRFTDIQGRTIRTEHLPVQRALAERKVIDGGRLWYTRPNGDRILLSVVSSPFLNMRGDLKGAVALVRDVTEQEREHERLQQVDKMRALGQLSSGVAHNFNNSLASILGYTHLALRKADGAEIEKYLEIIQKSAQDAARMVERIQNFSRSQARSGDFRPILLADIVRDAVEIGRPRWRNDAESLGIRYDVLVEWDAADVLFVEGEPSELREVFLNIILNALDAMPSGGSLIVSGSSDSETVAVSFSDTGMGMTPEIKLRVFEPFFTTKGMAGLGLGLSESY
ncbi:MAG TPA: PAS domain S-box protein, partial [Blastocatellia bacterium]|nr:PAS domain S-box protein [Blastocatellia bacterium]